MSMIGELLDINYTKSEYISENIVAVASRSIIEHPTVTFIQNGRIIAIVQFDGQNAIVQVDDVDLREVISAKMCPNKPFDEYGVAIFTCKTTILANKIYNNLCNIIAS